MQRAIRAHYTCWWSWGRPLRQCQVNQDLQGGVEVRWTEKGGSSLCFLGAPTSIHTIWSSFHIILPVTNLFNHSSRAPVFDVGHIMATDRDAILVAWSWSQPRTHILLAFNAHLLYFLFIFSYSLRGCSMILRKRISRKSRWRGKRSDFNLGLTACRTLCPVCPGHSIIGSFSGSVDNCWRVHFRDDKPELRKLST